jgi:hypothetical protein
MKGIMQANKQAQQSKQAGNDEQAEQTKQAWAASVGSHASHKHAWHPIRGGAGNFPLNFVVHTLYPARPKKKLVKKLSNMNRRRLVFHPKNLPLHKMFAMLSSMGFC